MHIELARAVSVKLPFLRHARGWGAGASVWGGRSGRTRRVLCGYSRAEKCARGTSSWDQLRKTPTVWGATRWEVGATSSRA
jgi:hypothetical protein